MKPKYRVMDFSYGNLRMLDKHDKILVIDRQTLQTIINSLKLEQIKEPRQKYPHLVIKAGISK